jgi:hypothetical protein
MAIEEQCRERLRKVEALLAGAATPGERSAAGAALERLKATLAEVSRQDPPIELQFSMPDPWSMRLFVALCRRYSLRPYRYPRQRRTTIMVRAPRRFFEEVVWKQFSNLHTDLELYFEQVTEKLIRESIFADTSDAEVVPAAMEPR